MKFLVAKHKAFQTNSQLLGYCDLNLKTLLEGRNVIHKNVCISSSKVGYGTYIGRNSDLSNVFIGKYCSIAEGVKVIKGRHPTDTFVSTHPAFFSTKKQAGFTYVNEDKFEENKYVNGSYSAIIGNDVWIGSNTMILEGVSIGDGVIVAAGSLVTKDLDDFGIYGGVPAKKIKDRFSQEAIDFLKENKWWGKKEDWIEGNVNLFSDIELFVTNGRSEKGKVNL